MRTSRLLLLAAVASGLQLAGTDQLRAQEERELGWFNTTELSFVLTAGNAETSTFGLNNTLERRWERSTLKLAVGAIRTESTIITRSAVGDTPDDFRVVEEESSETTAESYFARGRYDHELSSRVFVYGGAGWERNEFAGVKNRYSVVAGLGNTWFETDVSSLSTDYGITYTIQDDLVEVPGADDSFVGARLSYEYKRALTGTTDYGSELVLDENLEETDDFRANFINSLAVSISQQLALKTSLSLLYDNLPSLVSIPLQRTDGTPVGENVAVELDELDTIFTVALVVTI